MRKWVIATATAAIAPPALGLLTAAAAQTPAAPTQAYTQTQAYQGPRTPDGKPDLNGIWQVVNEAHWNLEPHSAQMGIPAGIGVVEGDEIPYKPDAAKKR